MVSTLIIFVASAAMVLAAGEAVRGQCRRMLSRPASIPARAVTAVRTAAPTVEFGEAVTSELAA